MHKHISNPAAFILLAILIGFQISCKHSPIIDMSDDDFIPVDTTDNPVDTTMMGDPCDPDLVYFDLQILPILQSNCAFSGCHDVTTAENGIILENYESVMQTGDIVPFNPGESELFEKITETDPDDIMPPPPNNPLTQEQIDLIALWIQQGAEDLECDPGIGCDTTAVTYSGTVIPILQNNCIGCHGGNNPSGNLTLSNYAGVQAVALDGRLLGAIQHLPGYPAMPQGADQLPDCSIDQIRIWVEAGAPQN